MLNRRERREHIENSFLIFARVAFFAVGFLQRPADFASEASGAIMD
jgi:hypothetical protein